MPIKSGKVFAPMTNNQPGMNDSQRDADSKTFGTTWAMNGGGGEFMEEGAGSGPQVGNAYDGSVMGDVRQSITYPNGGKGKTPKI